MKILWCILELPKFDVCMRKYVNFGRSHCQYNYNVCLGCVSRLSRKSIFGIICGCESAYQHIEWEWKYWMMFAINSTTTDAPCRRLHPPCFLIFAAKPSGKFFSWKELKNENCRHTVTTVLSPKSILKIPYIERYRNRSNLFRKNTYCIQTMNYRNICVTSNVLYLILYLYAWNRLDDLPIRNDVFGFFEAVRLNLAHCALSVYFSSHTNTLSGLALGLKLCASMWWCLDV